MIARARSPLPWLAGLLALYLLAPVIAFAARLGGGVSAAPGLSGALLTSLLTATVSTGVIGLLGIPLAYLLARGRGLLAQLLVALVALPLALPPLMSGLLLLYVLGPYTTVGRLFGGRLTDTRIGIVLAQTFVAAPFLIIAARSAFAAVDPALEDMAAALGHGRLARFARVAVPAALPGIGAGLLLAWLRSFGEFGATVVLAYHPYSLPVLTFVQFGASGLPATMLPVAAALAAALAVLLLGGLHVPRRRHLPLPARASTPGPASASVARAPVGSVSVAPLPIAARLLAPVSVVPGPPPKPPVLDFELSKRLGAFSLQIAHRAHSARLALVGPSGAGKTLTLRLLAGLSASEGGHVLAGSRALHQLPVERRGIGYVPQQPALLPRCTVWRQVAFGAGASPAVAAAWLARLGLAGFEDRFPEELSGGQRRRVALARALAIEPGVLLLDEPFTGLDAPVRDGLRRELRRLQREAGLCTVLVTHDPEEAALLADEIIVLEDGRVLQAGTRQDVFNAPCSPAVARLLGIANAAHGVVVAAGRINSDGVDVQIRPCGLAPGDRVAWCVRPEHVRLDRRGRYHATLLDDADLGSTRELTVSLAGALELTLRTADRSRLALGTTVRLEIDPQDIVVWALREAKQADRRADRPRLRAAGSRADRRAREPPGATLPAAYPPM